MSAAPRARWTIVTGASSGIGAELARLFAADGDGVVLVARRRERIESLAEELASRHGVETRPFVQDLEDPAAPQALADRLAAEGIVPHTLVNNAGFGLRGRFATLPAERELAMVRLNVMAPTALARLFLPGMIARRQGGILNVASLAAYQAGPYMAVYYATKAYLLSLSEALHEEARPAGVTVTALCPGPVTTEFGAVADLEGSGLSKMAPIGAGEAARAGFEAYRAGRAVVVPGTLAKLSGIGARLLPRALTRKAAARLQGVE